jgi:Glycoside-hydrolase family GH114
MLARPRPTLKQAVVLVAALAGFVLHTSPVGARALARLHISPRSGPVGALVSVTDSGFRPRVRGIFLVDKRRVASFKATGSGTVFVRFLIPRGVSGRVRILAAGVTESGRAHAASFRVTAREPHSGSSGSSKHRSGHGGSGPGGSGGSAGSGSGSSGGGSGSGGSGSGTSSWIPPKSLTWYWQLQGTVNNSQPVAAYDIDGFENSAAEVATLHGQGKHVICYIDVGTAENWRADYGSFPASVLGSSNGWPGERWLDIRQLSVLEPIMTARFQMCRQKGFDAVEPDNMDGYENSTGFPLTAAEQLSYDEWIAGEVHALGMAVFQKNDGEQSAQLESHFDGALDEQCNQYHECANFQPYLAAGKPVLNAEYSLSTSSFCAADEAAGIMGARYSLELNGSSFEPCW